MIFVSFLFWLPGVLLKVEILNVIKILRVKLRNQPTVE